jgi:hypothetical protein
VVGIIQKQSSFYFQATTAETVISNNVVFNIPRAAINFNDGFGGGNEILNNLLFNTCRESSDHGAFNSWDRLPYITTIGDGSTPSTIPAWNNVHSNFIVANFAADGGCLDNDDGSSYYDIHHNVCVFGGHKSDFDGNRKLSHDNLHLYPSVYGVTCLNIGAQVLPPSGYAEGYFNNTCVLPNEGSLYLNIGGVADGECLDGSAHAIKQLADGLLLGNNTVYVPSASASISCGGKKTTSKAFETFGIDQGTSFIGKRPSNDTMVAWMREMLSMNA